MKVKVIVIALVLTGCAARYTQVYSGPELPKSDVAMIAGELQGTKPWPEFREWVVIRRVDGTEIDRVLGEWVTKVQVLPGQRTLEVNTDYDGYGTLMQVTAELFRSILNQTLTLDAQAGHEYRIRFRRTTDRTVLPPTTGIVYWIEDAGTGEVISGAPPASSQAPSP